MATVFGIDLGTTYSCISKCDDHQMVRTFSPKSGFLGGSVLPSVVYFDDHDGTPTVGQTAKEYLKAPAFANQTLAYFKRHMGEEFCPEEISCNGNKRHVSPVEGSACILHSLLDSANEDEKGEGNPEVRKAVITIPAGYTSKQRECTKMAAELAGIEVLGLIHEPTAAAVSYNIKSGETVLVFDLGGGTLDVSIVSNTRGNYRVLASASDFDTLGRYLGGKDWDDALLDYVVSLHEWKRDKDNKAMEGQLRAAAENCKIALTQQQRTPFNFPDFTSEMIMRADFDRIAANLVNDCMKVVKYAIEKADKESNNGKVAINRCVMAGGSSNMPMIKRSLSRQLADRIANGRPDSEWLHLTNPEKAIAEGAARYAYMLEHHITDNTGITIEERSSHSYGTSVQFRHGNEVLRGVRNLILATDPMIVQKERSFYPHKNGQEGIGVDVYENNSTETKLLMDDSCKEIYKKVYMFTPKKRSSVTTSTEVKFAVSRDKDGIISIKVTCDGHPTENHSIATVIPPVSKIIQKQILHSIELMNQSEGYE